MLTAGGDLLEHINNKFIAAGSTKNKKPYTSGEVRSLLSGLLEAIRFLHHNGVAHRDIKPENTMYPEEHIKLIDFGWADVFEGVKVARGSSKSIGVVQTKEGRVDSGPWTAPEQKKIQHFKTFNPFKSDIFSCGMILYTLLSGKNPRGGPKQIKANLNSRACSHMSASEKASYSIAL